MEFKRTVFNSIFYLDKNVLISVNKDEICFWVFDHRPKWFFAIRKGKFFLFKFRCHAANKTLTGKSSSHNSWHICFLSLLNSLGFGLFVFNITRLIYSIIDFKGFSKSFKNSTLNPRELNLGLHFNSINFPLRTWWHVTLGILLPLNLCHRVFYGYYRKYLTEVLHSL